MKQTVPLTSHQQRDSCLYFLCNAFQLEIAKVSTMKRSMPTSQVHVRAKVASMLEYDRSFSSYSSDANILSAKKRSFQIASLVKFLEPALHLCRRSDIKQMVSRLSKYRLYDDYVNRKKWRLELDWLKKSFEPALQFCSKQFCLGRILAFTRFTFADNDPTVNSESSGKSTSNHGKCKSEDKNMSDKKWKLELSWLIKYFEPLYRWAPLQTGNVSPPSSRRSVMEIFTNIQQSKIGTEEWSISDFTIGLYLLYLRHASIDPLENIKGEQIISDSMIQDLIYYVELATGAYASSANGLAKGSMIRESNIVKHVNNSSVMRPAYYIGIDTRKKLVILGIRGTNNIYDLITNVVTSGDGKFSFDGYSIHVGSAEAARWFLTHETKTLKLCLDKYKGFKLRIVGHSLGGATASLLAIMLHKMSFKDLGFDPHIVSAIGIASPPCVTAELAESCADFVTTVVMPDDIVPRLSAPSLMRLRCEILQTDWMSILDKEDCKNLLVLLTNAKQVVSSIQDLAQKLADYADFRRKTSSDVPAVKKEPPTPKGDDVPIMNVGVKEDELFTPGTVYYLKRNASSIHNECAPYFTLWKRLPSQHFKRVILGSNLFSDHTCDGHYFALRDALKGLD